MSDPDPKVTIDIGFRTLEELEKAFDEQIKSGGFFVPSDSPHPRTTPVLLRFSLPGLPKPLEVPAEVAFSAGPDAPMPGMGAGMAIQFSSLSDKLTRAFQAAITVARAEGMDAGTADEGEGDESGASFGEMVRRGEDDEEGDDYEPSEWDDNDDYNDDYSDDEDGEEDGGGGEEDDEITSANLMAVLSKATGEQLYFTVRKLPLHQKVVAAKRGNRAVRNILLQEGNKKIVNFLLQNPQISTPEVLQMLKTPNLSQEIIKSIAKNSAFSQNEEIKFQIVTNPKTPLPMALNFLNALNVNNLAKLAKSGNVKHQIKSNALKLLETRRK